MISQHWTEITAPSGWWKQNLPSPLFIDNLKLHYYILHIIFRLRISSSSRAAVVTTESYLFIMFCLITHQCELLICIMWVTSAQLLFPELSKLNRISDSARNYYYAGKRSGSQADGHPESANEMISARDRADWATPMAIRWSAEDWQIPTATKNPAGWGLIPDWSSYQPPPRGRTHRIALPDNRAVCAGWTMPLDNHFSGYRFPEAFTRIIWYRQRDMGKVVIVLDKTSPTGIGDFTCRTDPAVKIHPWRK